MFAVVPIGFSLWSFMNQMSLRQAHCFFFYRRDVSGYAAQSRQDFIPQFSGVSQMFFRFTVLLLYTDNKRHSLLSKNGSYYLFYTTLYLNGNFAYQMLTVLFVFISSSCPGSEDVNSRDQGGKVRSASGRALLKCS